MRKILKYLGVALVLCGIGLSVFVGYSIYTPLEASNQRSEASKIETAIEAQRPPVTAQKRSVARPSYMTIPRLGDDWKVPVVEGVGSESLAQGIGHYPTTPIAGDQGNAAYAGHRTGHGSPLLNIEKVRVGDEIIVHSVNGAAVYKVHDSKVVLPSDVSVLQARSGRWLTLTTCWPKYGNEKRYILFARMS